MKKIISTLLILLIAASASAANFYGKGLCDYPQYECITIKSGESWETLFPNVEQREIVQKVNRSYNALYSGKVIAVPRDLPHLTLFDVSPFPLKMPNEHQKEIIVDQDKLAFAAYDAEGNLVMWGPISSGQDRCSDSDHSCRTLTGIYRVFSKENEKCVSDIFPIGKGGAKMPFCMYFHKGFALHGSVDLPGYRASHGCVRLFNEDAKWLNQQFVDLSSEHNNFMGTKVIVRPINGE